MSRRALRAGLCALAALAFLLAAFVPWFESQRGTGGDDDGPRASYQLQGGERCDHGRCHDVGYTGARGLGDDGFAALGWATLAGALGTVALTLAVAGVRRRHRPLRAWAATSAALTAGLGAMFVASETLSRSDDVARGWGLAALVIGAMVAGLGLAAPSSEPLVEHRPERRWALVVALAGGAGVAWLSLANHGWWHGVGAFRAIAASPLGREVCDGDDCQSGALGGGDDGFRLCARLTVGLIAALLVPATGAAARTAWGYAAGAWGVATVILALLGLAVGVGAAALHPSGVADSLAWGLPTFAAALVATTAAALLARRRMTATELDEPEASAPVRTGLQPRAATAVRLVLPSLGAAPAPTTATAPAATTSAAAVAVTSISPGIGVWTRPLAPAPEDAHAGPRVLGGPSLAPAPAAVVGAHEPGVPPNPATASPPWALATREAFEPPPPPRATATPSPVVTAPVLARRVSPTCPGCRQATLWHGKRGAWWCSTCKRVL